MTWITSFRKEIEKISGIGGTLAMGGLNLMDLQGQATENTNKVKMIPLRQQAQALQLPGSSSFDFEGSKRIDSTANETSDKF